MHRFTSEWLREHGVEGDDATLEDVAGHAQRALEMMINEAAAQELTAEQVKEFKKLLTKDISEAERLQWLKEHCPNYEQIVEQVAADFKKDIANSEHRISFILEQQIKN